MAVSEISIPKPYPWQHEQWEKLLRLAQTNRLPHALLLSGEPETGKLEFALAAARYMLCRQVGPGVEKHNAEGRSSDNTHPQAHTMQSCGECSSCALLNAGSHPDFLLLQPEEPGKQLRIDLMRNLNQFSGERSHQGGWKVVVIEPAEALNINAANALLKTLEEPGEQTLLMLVSHRPGGLLPTIRSRCQLLSFPLVPADVILPWLHEAAGVSADDKPEAQMVRALERAGNRPLRALRYSEQQTAASIEHFEQLVESVATGEVSPLQAAEDCHRLEFNEALGWFARLHTQRLRAQVERDERLSPQLLSFNDCLIQATQRLLSTSNLNPQLVWEELLMDWRRALRTNV